jgi:hypothetical protein
MSFKENEKKGLRVREPANPTKPFTEALLGYVIARNRSSLFLSHILIAVNHESFLFKLVGDLFEEILVVIWILNRCYLDLQAVG